MILVIIAAIYRLSNNNLIKLMFFIVFDRTKYVADWWNSIFRRQRRPKHFVTHMAHIVCECALFLCDAIINTCHSLWFLFLFEYFWNKTTPWQKKKNFNVIIPICTTNFYSCVTLTNKIINSCWKKSNFSGEKPDLKIAYCLCMWSSITITKR